jgi:hypothetical protein
MKKYLIKRVDSEQFVLTGLQSQTPTRGDYALVVPVPKDLEDEDEAWLKVEDTLDPETGETSKVVTVDEDLKSKTLNERQQAETERLAAETVRKQAQDARLTRIRSADLDRADINQLRAVVKDIVEHLNLKGEGNGNRG